jgi:hypothetical protein
VPPAGCRAEVTEKSLTPSCIENTSDESEQETYVALSDKNELGDSPGANQQNDFGLHLS